MTEFTDNEIDAIQGRSYRTGNLSGQERTLKDVLRYVQEEMAKYLTLTAEGWQIPEGAHKAVLAAVSKRVQDELAATDKEFKKHRAEKGS